MGITNGHRQQSLVGQRFGPYYGCVKLDRLRQFCFATGETAPNIYFPMQLWPWAGETFQPLRPIFFACRCSTAPNPWIGREV